MRSKQAISTAAHTKHKEATDSSRLQQAEDARCAALNLMEDAVEARRVTKGLNIKLRANEARLAKELAMSQLLQELSTRLTVEDDIDKLYDEILDAALTIMGCSMGSMQIFDEGENALRQLTSRGFDAAFDDTFKLCRLEVGSVCCAAWRTRKRVIVPDVEESDSLAGSAELEALRNLGVRAVQSTPLISRGGRFLGMISTHWHKPHYPKDSSIGMLDILARLAADLIERTLNNAALRESEARFRVLADNISQLAWIADAKGEIYWYNERWYSYTGTKLSDMRGRGWEKVVHPEHVGRVVERMRRSWKSGEAWEDTFPLRGRDGAFRWFLSRALPIYDENGAVLRWFGTNTDVTEQLQMKEQLSKEARRKDEFLAALGHELRNPLAPIRSGLELIKFVRNDAAALEEIRAMMERQVTQMVRLIDDLLDISRITRGKLELRRSQVDLAVIMDAAVEAARPFIEEAGHELTVTLPKEKNLLHADAQRLVQVFSNLLNNAARYTPEGGKICLSAEREPRDIVLVTCKDSGIGIAPAMQERVFDMFSQIKDPALGRNSGLGIGLTLVKRLVELHGGSVEVASAGANQGSEFRVRLPALAALEVSEEFPHQESLVQEGGLRILVVDDNEDAATMLSRVAEKLGNDVRTVFDGKQALVVAEEFHPDVVMMDIGMPQMSGNEAARLIREQPWGKGMVLVAVTGCGQEKDREKTREAGFNQHLVKPVEPAALRELFAEVLHESQ